jgi:hypothetical protein
VVLPVEFGQNSAWIRPLDTQMGQAGAANVCRKSPPPDRPNAPVDQAELSKTLVTGT